MVRRKAEEAHAFLVFHNNCHRSAHSDVFCAFPENDFCQEALVLGFPVHCCLVSLYLCDAVPGSYFLPLLFVPVRDVPLCQGIR